MATKANRPESGERVLVPAGTYPARVFKFMNLGARVQEYQGKPKDYPDTLINISWELPTELHQFTKKHPDGTETTEEKPLVISREFTLSMGIKSNLRPIVEGIVGATLTDEEAYNFDLEELIGMTSLVTISHKESKANGKIYANVVSTAPLIRGMSVSPAVNTPIIFNVSTATEEEIEALPQFLKDKVYESDEYKDRFDKETLERRKEIQNTIDNLRNQPKPEDELEEDEIPF
jgi:hypothetical protein